MTFALSSDGAESSWAVPEPVVPAAPARSGRRTLRGRREIDLLLKDLTEEQRLYIRLSYVHGLLHSEIAEWAGLPASAVSSAIAAGMQQIARSLEGR